MGNESEPKEGRLLPTIQYSSRQSISSVPPHLTQRQELTAEEIGLLDGIITGDQYLMEHTIEALIETGEFAVASYNNSVDRMVQRLREIDDPLARQYSFEATANFKGLMYSAVGEVYLVGKDKMLETLGRPTYTRPLSPPPPPESLTLKERIRGKRNPS